MRDLTDPRLMYLKAILFVFAGVTAGTALLVERMSMRDVFLLIVCVWCFARAYYFLFYVIERYIDPRYKFAGVGSAVVYLVRRRFRGASRKA